MYITRHAPPLVLFLSLGLTLLPHQLLSQSADGPPAIPGPSFEDVISVEGIGSVSVSADGNAIAYTVSSTDWDENQFSRQIWLARTATNETAEPFQLTRGEKSSRSPQFAPSGTRLAFLTDRGNGSEIFIIDTRGGEASAVTDFEGSISSFAWSKDGKSIAFVATPSDNSERDARKKAYGDYAGEDEDLTYSHLWVIELDSADGENSAKHAATQLTSGEDFTVGSFDWAPDGSSIAFDHRPRPVIDDFVRSDISIVDVSSTTVRPLMSAAAPESGPLFSPDGKRVAFSSSFDNNPYYGNTVLATVPTEGGEAVLATEQFDEDASAIAWTDDGLWFTASQRTERAVFTVAVDSAGGTGAIERVDIGQPMLGSVDVTASGMAMAYTAQSAIRTSELYSRDLTQKGAGPVRHTDQQASIDEWPLGTRELVRWKSKDGAEIEGVLMLPEGHDRTKPAPLMVVIHGGPTGTSRPTLVSGYVYPVMQWLAKGAIVLQPNYRGSAGYGGAFRALNVRNLGVGDAWDVESGVQHLIDEGLADKDKLGAMGWSQGGYISAFLATNSTMFKALSNGAGISDWMTYYVNTDIHGFTRNYLGATPWEDPAIYALTSPMTNIRRAQTPTLIQHGEFDRRVPVPNAYQLYQGLQDVGVETRLVIYKGFGHGISKPKERLAAMWHNWQWFGKYVWGEEIELPIASEEAEGRDGDD